MKLNRRNLFLASSATITIAFTAPFASALPYNWIGADAGAWNTAGNWSGVVVPTSADDLTILGPLNVAGPLNINFDADNAAQSLIFTNTGGNSTSLTNTTSGSDKTLTLGTGGITTGTGAVQIGANATNQAVNITLGAAQTWNIGTGGLTVTNVVSGAATGFTKTGAGNLIFNGSTVQGFTGGLNANGGTVTLDYTNLTIPTDLVAATNALQMSSGALTITGQDVAFATTAQTFAGTTLGAGLNTVKITKGALATSATLNLGALTVNSGSSAIFVPTTASVWTTTASATEKVFITAGGSVPALPGAGTTAFVGGSVFHRVGNQTAGSLRLAAVDEFGQLLNKASVGDLAIGTGVDPTGSYDLNAGSIALTGPATSVYGLLLNANATSTNITVPNSGTLTLNSMIQIASTQSVNVIAGTGVSNVVIGAEKNLVLAMDNAAALSISAPIANFNSTGGIGGDASAVTIVGTNSSAGAVTLSGNNTYSGVTTVDGTAQTASKTLLTVANNNAFGTTAAGTVLIGGAASNDGPRILLNNGITVTGETLTIRTGGTGTRSSLTQATNATSAWNGNIVVDANTGFGQIFANGATGVMTLGASASDTLILNGTQGFRGTGLGTVNSTISGAGGFNKTDAGTWTLTAANGYSGTTRIDVGTLRIGAGSTTGTLGTGNVAFFASTGTLQFNRTDTYTLAAGNLVTGAGAVTLANTGSVATAVDGQFNTTGALNFGSAAASLVVSALDLTNGSSSFGSLNVRTNSASNNTTTIGSGKTLQINGAVTVGITNGNSTTKLAVTGPGTLSFGTSGAPTNASVAIGAGTASNDGNNGTLDVSGLSTFYANLGNGTFRVGSPTNGSGAASGSSSAILAGTSTIQATNLNVGSPDGSSAIQSLLLGNVTNTLNVTNITVGSSGRSSANLLFNGVGGDLTVRGLDGTPLSRANLALGTNTFPTSTGIIGTFDTTAHNAFLRFDTMTVGQRTAGNSGTGSATGNFTFNQGTLDADNLVAGSILGSASAGNGNAVGNVNLSGGTATFNSLAGPMGLGVNINNKQSGTGNLNISGTANVTVTANASTSIRLGDATVLGGTATGNVNLTGGTLTVAGDIIRGATTGTSNATLNLIGGTLDMGGNDIGAAGLGAVTLTTESGTLSNVATINGTGGLTKTGNGTLVVAGSNTYTGNTTINAGTLALGANNTLPDTTPVSLGNATLDASTFADTLGTLDAAGNATINLGSAAANLAFANSSGITWSGDLNITGTFVPGSSLQFGNSTAGLSGAQLTAIKINNVTGNYTLNPGGFLIVTGSANPYATWSGGAGFYADANGDGVPNGMTWLLGGANTTSNGLALLPAPVVSGGNMTLNFKTPTPTAPAKLFFEYGNNLVGWTPLEITAANNTVGSASFVVTPFGNGTNNVSLIVNGNASLGGGKLFGRFNSKEN